jgi:hypothetical protein
MVMLIKIHGSEYTVWDKAAAICFKKPGTSTLYATFSVTSKEIKHYQNRPCISAVSRTDLSC